MSHGKVRDEKTCLNCGAPVPDRFCAHCGQENIEPKQTVWHLVNHFFSDVTHFDGKFFTTVKDLFLKPGFLSKEYVKGRRVSYLDPIRMYIFTSAFFFLIFFSIVNLRELEKGRILGKKGQYSVARKTALSHITSHTDSVSINAGFDALEKGSRNDPGEDEDEDHGLAKGGRLMREKTDSANRAADSINHLRAVSRKDSVRSEKKKSDSDDDEEEALNIGSGKNYKTTGAYDSAQSALPKAQRDNWMKRVVKRKVIETNNKWRDDKEGLWREWVASFLHNFPKMLFISLPLFALLLKLLYIRRKEFFYVDHGIFSVHLYIFSFIVILIMFGFYQLEDLTHWSVFNWIVGIIFFYPFWYYYKSMRNFYCQGRGKTLLKYFTLLLLSFIFQLTLFVLFFLFSIVET